MAKKSAVNKSQAIRDALADHPDKSPSEIAELLKANGVNITAQYVSTIKSNARIKARRPVVGRRGRPARGTSGSGMSTMEAALALIKSAGGLEQAKNVLTTIEHRGFFWRAGMPISYQPNLLPRSQDLMPIVEETTALYGITRAALLKYRSRIGARPFFLPVSRLEAIDLNTEEDFNYLEWLVTTGRAELLSRERRELLHFPPACAA